MICYRPIEHLSGNLKVWAIAALTGPFWLLRFRGGSHGGGGALGSFPKGVGFAGNSADEPLREEALL